MLKYNETAKLYECKNRNLRENLGSLKIKFQNIL